ncbi:Peptide methionine sulfoxide reductase MsrA [Spatholobus suberectus]|nr:Peptide methionine sulfoxide reductase MsrA [Spatholobus suberectus]
MYKILPQLKNDDHDDDGHIHESTSNTAAEFLCEAVFAGDKFQGIEAAYGRMDGVVRTATGYCGGTLKKPTYREVCEGRTGHTEAVKVIYNKRKVSYQSLCDLFWETHDPTKNEYQNRHQKFFLQKQCRLCESLGLRSTQQFVGSDVACKFNGILAMEGEMIIDELSTFLNTHNLSKQTKLACEDLVEELRTNYAKGNNRSL